MDRQKILILMVVFLLIVRFGIYPLHQMATDKNAELEQKAQRHQKGQELLAKAPQYNNQLAEAERVLAGYASLYPKVEDRVMAQLTVQQQLQSIAAEQEVNLDEFEWLDTREGTPEIATIKISFTGNLKNLMHFTMQAENLGPWIASSELDYRVNKQRVNWKELGKAKGSLFLTVSYIVNKST